MAINYIKIYLNLLILEYVYLKIANHNEHFLIQKYRQKVHLVSKTKKIFNIIINKNYNY